jgi:hypothetical protein
MVCGVEDLKVIRYLFERVRYTTCWDAFRQVDRLVGDMGLPLVQSPYTGLGFLMSRYAGIEQTVYLAADEPEQFEETVATINAAHERVFTLLAEGPSQVLFQSDNLSSDVQSPPWLERYSGTYYRTMARIAHAHDKPLVLHLDGRLRGLLRTLAGMGIDGVDAVTPAPWGDLTPQSCRDEAGPAMVLSGGIPPDSFHAEVPLRVLDEQIDAWLDLRRQSPALILAPGDQLPPDGEMGRVCRLVRAAAGATYD